MLFGQKFPRSEAAEAGATLGEMVQTLFAPMMIFLLIIHAMVGYVELGTDSWIAKITGAIMSDPKKGLLLFSYTSMLMFVLRFFAGPIVHRISPLGLLLVSAILGAAGLTLLGSATSVTLCIVAATVYALGKTFLWPTMLAVVSEQYPKGGAVSIGMLGGVGMLSAGLLGGPAIGFKQDYNASAKLQETSPEAFDRYKSAGESTFMGFSTVGLDGAKVGILEDDGQELARAGQLLAEREKTESNAAAFEEQAANEAWWEDAKQYADEDQEPVTEAGFYGGKQALKLTAYVPATMAVCYLILILYFKSKGGYRPVSVAEAEEEMAAGTAES
jgi:hypothetical protein